MNDLIKQIGVSANIDTNDLKYITVMSSTPSTVSFTINNGETIFEVESTLTYFVDRVDDNETTITNEVDVNRIVNFLAGGKI